jgi:hypothetical protein
VRKLQLDGEPFERIFALRASDDLELTERDANELFASYLAQLERVIEVVDRMDEGAQSGAHA